MKKKVLVSFLIAALACSVCACGSENKAENSAESQQTVQEDGINKESESEVNNMTKDELLAVAEECKVGTMWNDAVENLAKAKQTYCDKNLAVTGQIGMIAEDHIVLGDGYSGILKVYLPLEELVNLEKDYLVTVVGHTTNEVEYQEPVYPLGETIFYSMENAYIVEVTDPSHVRVQVTGVIQTAGIKPNDSSKIYGVKFADGYNKDDYMWQEVTIDAVKVTSDSGIITYEDAIVVE